eukprot:TRINITY_DN12896_c0_g1_i2.p1 TRINITY_DN12896_c0_g1~~TRINITY_DN12896_c0_g1_i2.p1  ORF type:complete len:226 (+),score=40.64 TRINITY_DN12896_c0_g1_i2:376-1053(+)
MTLPAELPDSWLQSFTNALTTTLDAKLQPLNTRMTSFETRHKDIIADMNDMKADMNDMKSKMQGLENKSMLGSTAASNDAMDITHSEYKATRIEFKGWSTFSTRSTAGWARIQCQNLLTSLTAELSEDLKKVVKNLDTQGVKCTNFYVTVNTEHIAEVLNIWKQHLETKVLRLCHFRPLQSEWKGHRGGAIPGWFHRHRCLVTGSTWPFRPSGAGGPRACPPLTP